MSTSLTAPTVTVTRARPSLSGKPARLGIEPGGRSEGQLAGNRARPQARLRAGVDVDACGGAGHGARARVGLARLTVVDQAKHQKSDRRHGDDDDQYEEARQACTEAHHRSLTICIGRFQRFRSPGSLLPRAQAMRRGRRAAVTTLPEYRAGYAGCRLSPGSHACGAPAWAPVLGRRRRDSRSKKLTSGSWSQVSGARAVPPGPRPHSAMLASPGAIAQFGRAPGSHPGGRRFEPG